MEQHSPSLPSATLDDLDDVGTEFATQQAMTLQARPSLRERVNNTLEIDVRGRTKTRNATLPVRAVTPRLHRRNTAEAENDEHLSRLGQGLFVGFILEGRPLPSNIPIIDHYKDDSGREFTHTVCVLTAEEALALKVFDKRTYGATKTREHQLWLTLKQEKEEGAIKAHKEGMNAVGLTTEQMVSAMKFIQSASLSAGDARDVCILIACTQEWAIDALALGVCFLTATAKVNALLVLNQIYSDEAVLNRWKVIMSDTDIEFVESVAKNISDV